MATEYLSNKPLDVAEDVDKVVHAGEGDLARVHAHQRKCIHLQTDKQIIFKND